MCLADSNDSLDLVGTRRQDAVAHLEMKHDCRSTARASNECRASQLNRERTHKNKAIIFSEIGPLDRQGAHSEYPDWFQWLAAILRPILANFVWIPARLLNWGANLCIPD